MDYTAKGLAEKAGLDSSRIHQLIALKENGLFPSAYQQTWQWSILEEKEDAWLEKRKQKWPFFGTGLNPRSR